MENSPELKMGDSVRVRGADGSEYVYPVVTTRVERDDKIYCEVSTGGWDSGYVEYKDIIGVIPRDPQAEKRAWEDYYQKNPSGPYTWGDAYYA